MTIRPGRALLMVTTAGMLAGSFVVPLEWMDANGIIICPWRLITGLLCPGCGLTHGFQELSHGHVHEAVAWNPLTPAVYLMVIGGFVLSLRARWLDWFTAGFRRVASGWRSAAISLTVLGLAVIFMVIRNQ